VTFPPPVTQVIVLILLSLSSPCSASFLEHLNCIPITSLSLLLLSSIHSYFHWFLQCLADWFIFLVSPPPSIHGVRKMKIYFKTENLFNLLVTSNYLSFMREVDLRYPYLRPYSVSCLLLRSQVFQNPLALKIWN
jgi:hypothetical protein